MNWSKIPTLLEGTKISFVLRIKKIVHLLADRAVECDIRIQLMSIAELQCKVIKNELGQVKRICLSWMFNFA